MNAAWRGTAPAAKCLSDADEARIDAIALGLDLTASNARSAAEAAWPGEIDGLESDLRRLRDQLAAWSRTSRGSDRSASSLAREKRYELLS